VEWEKREISIAVQADILSLNRSSLYYKSVAPSPEEVKIKHRIDEIYTEFPYFGSRRMAAMLCREGKQIHRHTVRKHMREMGISAIYPGPNLSKRNLQHKIYPYLLRNVDLLYPNHVWGIDITFIRMNRGWMFLVAIIDWYSRYVVSWELDQTLELPFVIEASTKALNQATPKIINSDQGSQFTSQKYIRLFQESGVQISMDGKGRATDNAITERLWRSVKQESVYIYDYQTPREARYEINKYFQQYNHIRPHQSLDYKTPAEVFYEGGEI
jgi:putative transposase